MKRILDRTDFVFTPGAAGAGAIAFRGAAPAFETIQLVTNVTRGVVVYQFNSTTKGSAGYNEVTNTLTLDFDTSTHSASDVLQVIVDDIEDKNGFTRVGGIDPRGYAMGLRVNERGHFIPSDQGIVSRTLDRVGSMAMVETTGYNSVVVQMAGTWAGTQTFEVSNDGTSWNACAGWSVTGGATPVTSATANGHWILPCLGRYFRVRFSTYTSGIAAVNLVLKNQPAFFPANSPSIAANSSVNVSQVGAGAIVAEDTASTANPIIVGGVARTALPAATVAAGDAVRATMTLSGQIVTKQNASADLDFYVNTIATGNLQSLLRAAQGAAVRQNVTQITYQNTAATASTFTLQDASTTLVTISVPASMTEPRQLIFPTPLRGSNNVALNFVNGTAGANILLNVTGFNSY
ncbi:MAG: hypothetical protein ACK52I_25375 [Pseudomonadota bacterium]|jgi:hypothetical protein